MRSDELTQDSALDPRKSDLRGPFRKLSLIALSASVAMLVLREWAQDQAPAASSRATDHSSTTLRGGASSEPAKRQSGKKDEILGEMIATSGHFPTAPANSKGFGAAGSGYSKGRGFGGRGAGLVPRVRQSTSRGTGQRHKGKEAFGRFQASPHSGSFPVDDSFVFPLFGTSKPKTAPIKLFRTKITRFSTISTDVDTAAYARMRSKVIGQRHITPSLVRAEEYINYFNYNIPDSTASHPIGIVTEASWAPWNTKRVLLRVGAKAKAKAASVQARKNLVFLLDTSGSMSGALDLVDYGLRQLLETLHPEDRVAIVTYAGTAGLALRPTKVAQKSKILKALDKIHAYGSTNGGAGLQLAYKMARKHYVKDGVNRVILATDGDFNVGIPRGDSLIEYIEKKRKLNIYLSVLGFSAGDHADQFMEQLADQGNGNYAYIDSRREAKRVLLSQAQGTLSPVADDVKIQVEFDPRYVAGHRVIGYKNRILSRRDFMNDKKDAGDMGAGQAATALYELELTPQGAALDSPEFAKISVRYRPFNQPKHQMFEQIHRSMTDRLDDTSDDFRFAASLAQFARVLTQSAGADTLEQVHRMAIDSRGKDASCERGEFAELVKDYACSVGVLEAKTWSKVQGCGFSALREQLRGCRNAPEPQAPRIPEPTLEVSLTSELLTPQDSPPSPFGYLARLLELFASWLRALPRWAALVPGALGLGLWFGSIRPEASARKKR